MNLTLRWGVGVSVTPSVSSAAEHLNRRLRNRRPTHSRDVEEKLWIFSRGLKIDVKSGPRWFGQVLKEDNV